MISDYKIILKKVLYLHFGYKNGVSTFGLQEIFMRDVLSFIRVTELCFTENFHAFSYIRLMQVETLLKGTFFISKILERSRLVGKNYTIYKTNVYSRMCMY